MSEKAPTLEQIAAAVMEADGKNPGKVLDAFLPKPTTTLGQRLLPLSAGHELLLGQISHPLATGESWSDSDVLMALFIFSRPSRELFSYVADDSFEAKFYEFIDTIPSADLVGVAKDMATHWTRSRATSLAMRNPHASGQKKTADSGGCLPRSAGPAWPMAGLRKWLCTTFRWCKFSR